MADQTAGTAVDAATAVPPAPPSPHRRPRVREVSSRFMSPLVQSNSTPAPTPNPSDFPRTKSVHRRHPSKTDENHNPEPHRGGVLDKTSAATSTVQKKQHQQRVKHHSKENGEIHHSEVRVSSRPDTPITIGMDRVVPSRYRQPSSSVYRSNPLNRSSSGCSAVSEAARLVQEATCDEEKKLSRISTSTADNSDSCSTTSNQGSSSCPNSPICMPVTKLRCATDIRSSMPDVDKWLADRSFDNSGKDCARSLNFSTFTKTGGGVGGVSRPPHPSSCVRAAFDSRKGRKVSNHQDDVHLLKMLHNHLLQWRFSNAKAEASMEAQKKEAEIKLCSLGGKISDLRENVKKKRIELAVLREMKTLATVVEAQMPYLTEWSTLEEDYSNSLSGTTNALLNSSVRLPVNGEVRTDIGQIGEALNSSFKVIESIGSHIQRFIEKAEATDVLVSELARLAGGEKALTEECWYLLSKTCSSQVNECSLRAARMQLNNYISNRVEKSEE